MDEELELLLSLDGTEYEMAPGVIVGFAVRRTKKTPQRPHGISYALVLRPKAGDGSIMRIQSNEPAGGASVLSMTTGTGQQRTRAVPMHSLRHSSCSMIFGRR
jgi:hypothetical protein